MFLIGYSDNHIVPGGGHSLFGGDTYEWPSTFFPHPHGGKFQVQNRYPYGGTFVKKRTLMEGLQKNQFPIFTTTDNILA